MTDVCREFGISRKTGYKILARYKDEGSAALTDRSRRPVRYTNQLPPQIETLISLQIGKPHWGARKIRELLVRRLPGDLRVPAQSTIQAVLDRHGLVARMGPSPPPHPGHAAVGRKLAQRPLVRRLQRRVPPRQQPLLLSAHGHRSRFALPAALRSPRLGARRAPSPPSPACSPSAGCRTPSDPKKGSRSPAQTPCSTSPSCRSGGCALRIAIERIKPGKPQQNGRHARMHLTLKKETTRPWASTPCSSKPA